MDQPLRPERPATRIQTANREAILAAALPIFATYGYRGTTIDQIAKRAGMSKPNLLYYFRRKEEIYEALLQRTLAEWLAPLRMLERDGDPETELRQYIGAKLRMSFEQPEASRLFANEVLNGAPVIRPFLETDLRALVEAKAEVIAHWVERGRIATVDPVHLIFLIWATTQHYADFAAQIKAVLGDRAKSPNFLTETTEAILSIVLNGVSRAEARS
ncbi:TetR family transcriptional regulator C-terminal domain-containing protein [Aureimonas sp. AU20]|uniref:TetR family transcriptional regulator C-terminal domain-containing protein n=1 Tax=Aureimonas sp. AU20 TaxID=1349819 RepID=UPI00071F9C38|nr:TetR family transcriptional regulator C-terminal domain-containing protein [Aureimonas sp. AU20]ALN72681.1 hypothetical protein M673_08150 [Aureimonas sp. AU20]